MSFRRKAKYLPKEALDLLVPPDVTECHRDDDDKVQDSIDFVSD